MKVWTKPPYISRNLTVPRVAYNTLVEELLDFLCRYTLQTKRPTDLDNSKLRRWIEKLRARLRARPPICEVSCKSREQGACFD